MPLAYEVRHAVPGRLRVWMPALADDDGSARAVVAWLRRQVGVQRVRFSAASGSLIVEHDVEPADIPDRLQLAFERLAAEGLAALPATAECALSVEPPDEPGPVWSRLALPTLAFGLSCLGGFVGGATALPLIAYTSLPILKRAITVLANEQRLNVDFLDGLAVLVSALQGQFATSSLMISLIMLGDTIRDFTAMKSGRAIADLLDYRGRTAWRLRDGELTQVPVGEIGVGDIVMLHPGELVPVDGTIVKGHGSVEQQAITGEAFPVPRGVGDLMYATSVVCEGLLQLQATGVGSDTVAARIVKTVESAPVGETRIQNYAEKWADAVVAPSLATAAGLYAMSADLNRFLSMVIVDYGTGIRVAAPTAVLASLRVAARRGILIKSCGHLEKLNLVDTIVFDKTGTLTTGVLEVGGIVAFKPRLLPRRRLLALAAAAESRLRHPVAEAVLRRAAASGIVPPEIDDWQYSIGLGVEARFNGTSVHVGNDRFLTREGIPLNGVARELRHLSERGHSAILIAVDGELGGLIPYTDAVRPESAGVLQAL